jgi:hypothetical protein
MASQMTRDQRKSATDKSRRLAGVCGSVGEGKIYGCHVVEVGAREEAEHTDGVQPHQHANHQDQDEAQEGWPRGPMLRQPRNLPSNRVFEVGWLRRVATYRGPIADPESSPKRALRKLLRLTAAQ